MHKKNAVVAAILSFLIPGLGQFYIGESSKGVMFLILWFVGWFLTFTVVGALFGVPILIVTLIWSVIAAALGANKT